MPTPIATDTIRADLQAARQRVTDLESLLELAERVYGTSTPSEPTVDPGGDVDTDALLDPHVQTMSTRDLAIDTLRLAGEPMSMPQLADAMTARGWLTKAENPVDTLKSSLKKVDDGVIVRVSRGMYVYRDPQSQQEEPRNLL